ncbi:unnamed protein product [Ambrosiozyma monospora]|uniref:Unnamed protein product n=1 Tax=Ambrosiozyma monospora TaxID=43982 RepID=A0ACB5SV07_AMBMO|nr:unnamed protein product [Ambrosiozyma monospora]
MFKKSNYKLLHTKLNTSKINSIISDWDSTITNRDTTPLVFQAIPESSFYQYPYFYKIYGDAYKQYMNEMLPSREEFKDRKNVLQECLFQRDFYDVECSSWNECVKRQVFKGVDKDVFQRLGQKVALSDNEFHAKEGFVEFWNWFAGLRDRETSIKPCNDGLLSHGSHNLEFRILSVGWSKTLIESYFKSQFASTSTSKSTKSTKISKSTSSPQAERVLPTQMILNEFEFDQNDKCTGQIDPRQPFEIRTGFDKLKCVMELNSKRSNNTKQISNNEVLQWARNTDLIKDHNLQIDQRHVSAKTVYIGDSTTDVLSMIYCDFAIIIKGGTAADKLQKLGYQVYDIGDSDLTLLKSDELDELRFVAVDDWFDLLSVFHHDT